MGSGDAGAGDPVQSSKAVPCCILGATVQAQTLSVMSDLSMKQDVFISASIKTSLKAILEIFDRVITMLQLCVVFL